MDQQSSDRAQSRMTRTPVGSASPSLVIADADQDGSTNGHNDDHQVEGLGGLGMAMAMAVSSEKTSDGGDEGMMLGAGGGSGASASGEVSGGILPGGPARKQNVACDGCRGRKVKCQRVPGADKCEHCKLKNLPCTSHYITQISSARKQKQTVKDSAPISNAVPGNFISPSAFVGAPMTPASASGNNAIAFGSPITPAAGNGTPSQIRGSAGMGLGIGLGVGADGGEPQSSIRKSNGDAAGSSRPSKRQKSNSRPASTSCLEPLTAPPPLDNSQKRFHLLEYLFSPQLVRCDALGYSDLLEPHVGKQEPTGVCEAFRAPPSQAHMKLISENERIDLASDLLETYFQIVQIRTPYIIDRNVREGWHHPQNPKGQLPTVAVALILAWGARFSEHPIIVQDREECSRGLTNGRKRSRIVELLTFRYERIVELDALYRVYTVQNVLAVLSLMALKGFHRDRSQDMFAINATVSMIQHLQYNSSQVLHAITDGTERAYASFTFWLVLWTDSAIAAYNRTLPGIVDGEYDVEPSQCWDAKGEPGDQFPWRQGDIGNWLVYHTAIDSHARIFRKLAGLWVPRVAREGVSLHDIRHITNMLSLWREEHLPKVGVPTVWPPSWDFTAAVTACGADTNFHIAWTVLHNAIEDFGVRELKMMARGENINAPGDTTDIAQDIERAKDRVKQEAMHGAMRIAALAAVLTANSYLRLDPKNCLIQLVLSGRLLARSGRKEVLSCIAGLRQIGLAFEIGFDYAEELEALDLQQPGAPQLPPSRNEEPARDARSTFSNPLGSLDRSRDVQGYGHQGLGLPPHAPMYGQGRGGYERSSVGSEQREEWNGSQIPAPVMDSHMPTMPSDYPWPMAPIEQNGNPPQYQGSTQPPPMSTDYENFGGMDAGASGVIVQPPTHDGLLGI